jgi:hypothetical protein
MIFDQYGFELAHQVFEGNQNDGKRLVAMVAELQQILGPEERSATAAKPLIILDGGVGTQQNLALLRQHGWGYLVNDSRRVRAVYRKEFVQEEGFVVMERHAGQSAVRVRVRADPESKATPPDQLVLCHSQGRREKETAIRSQAEVRFLAALAKLALRVQSGRLTDVAKIQRAIGRVQIRHGRVQRFYTVALVPAPQLAVTWSRVHEAYAADDELLGCYVLRTDRQERRPGLPNCHRPGRPRGAFRKTGSSAKRAYWPTNTPVPAKVRTTTLGPFGEVILSAGPMAK